MNEKSRYGRWRDKLQDMFFWVYLDAANLVRRTGQCMEFSFDRDER